MSIITEQDQNNIYDLYQEGILNRLRARAGNFIAGNKGMESRLRSLIDQYKTKIGRELGDLKADLDTFRGSKLPLQDKRLHRLLQNFSDIGVPNSQTLLDKIGHFTGRMVGAAAPAAAITMASGGLGAAPALAGALGAGMGSAFKNMPRTDIGTKGKLLRVGGAAALGGAAGHLGSKVGEWMSSGGGGAVPPSGTGAVPPGGGAAVPPVGGGNIFSPTRDELLKAFARTHSADAIIGRAGFDPNSVVDAAKMVMQIDGMRQGFTGQDLSNYVYSEIGSGPLTRSAARMWLSNRGVAPGQVVDFVINAKR